MDEDDVAEVAVKALLLMVEGLALVAMSRSAGHPGPDNSAIWGSGTDLIRRAQSDRKWLEEFKK